MISLLPFSSRYADFVSVFYNDPAYSHFSRGVKRYVKFDDCVVMDKILGLEILMIFDDVKNCVIGMIELREEDRVCKWAMAIHKEEQNARFGNEARIALERYCRDRIGARMLYTEVLSIDHYLGAHLSKNGYRHAGTIEEYAFVDGKYQDTLIYYKEVKDGDR